MRRLLAVLLGVALLAGGCTDAPQASYSALLPRTLNLFEGSEVRVRGVPVGGVTDLAAQGDAVLVTFTVDADVTLPADVTAVLDQSSLLSERFLALEPAYAGGPRLEAGATIPLDRTRVPAEVDEVLASLDALLAELDADVLADLVTALAGTLEGNGDGLNRLVDSATAGLESLAAARAELAGGVEQLAAASSVVAARQERLGPLLADLATVTGTIAEESDALLATVANLARLAEASQPLLERHGGHLADDIARMTTTLATLERNTERVAFTVTSTRRLFAAGGRAFDYERAMLRLSNHSEALGEVIGERLTNRLVGLCFRFGYAECATPAYWASLSSGGLCVPGLGPCEPGQRSLAEALGEAVEQLPEAARKAVTDHLAEDGDGQDAPQPAPLQRPQRPPPVEHGRELLDGVLAPLGADR